MSENKSLSVVPGSAVAEAPSRPSGGTTALMPASMEQAMKLAEFMSSAKLVPGHLQGHPADCLLVVEQAARWGLSPFAVAQSTAVIQGKLMYEGKLVAGVVNARGDLAERLSYSYASSGEGRTVTVSARLRGEKEPRTVDVRLGDVRTQNKVWQTQPDQQLAYAGARIWARRHMPELMLGVYTPDEFDDSTGPTIIPPRPDVPVVSSEPAKPEIVTEKTPPQERATPVQVRDLQVALGKMNIGNADADARELKGKDREEAIRSARLAWVNGWLGSDRNVTSTKDLTPGEAIALIEKAQAGEFPPTGDRDPGAEG